MSGWRLLLVMHDGEIFPLATFTSDFVIFHIIIIITQFNHQHIVNISLRNLTKTWTHQIEQMPARWTLLLLMFPFSQFSCSSQRFHNLANLLWAAACRFCPSRLRNCGGSATRPDFIAHTAPGTVCVEKQQRSNSCRFAQQALDLFFRSRTLARDLASELFSTNGAPALAAVCRRLRHTPGPPSADWPSY